MVEQRETGSHNSIFSLSVYGRARLELTGCEQQPQPKQVPRNFHVTKHLMCEYAQLEETSVERQVSMMLKSALFSFVEITEGLLKLIYYEAPLRGGMNLGVGPRC